MRLSGKTAVVTGGATGIGYAIATALADKGFREQFEATGLAVAAPASASAFAAQLVRETDRWAPLIREKKLALE